MSLRAGIVFLQFFLRKFPAPERLETQSVDPKDARTRGGGHWETSGRHRYVFFLFVCVCPISFEFSFQPFFWGFVLGLKP